jgi:hypothetical protein
MDFLIKNKVAIGAGIAILLLLYVYLTYFSSGPSPILTTSDANTPLSTDILVTLQSINSIKLDNTIFTDPVFVSLTDFGVTIPPETVGRRNPFAPLGASTKASTTTLKLPGAN